MQQFLIRKFFENQNFSFYNYFDCEQQCNGLTDPSSYLTADRNGELVQWNQYYGWPKERFYIDAPKYAL